MGYNEFMGTAMHLNIRVCGGEREQYEHYSRPKPSCRYRFHDICRCEKSKFYEKRCMDFKCNILHKIETPTKITSYYAGKEYDISHYHEVELTAGKYVNSSRDYYECQPIGLKRKRKKKKATNKLEKCQKKKTSKECKKNKRVQTRVAVKSGPASNIAIENLKIGVSVHGKQNIANISRKVSKKETDIKLQEMKIKSTKKETYKKPAVVVEIHKEKKQSSLNRNEEITKNLLGYIKYPTKGDMEKIKLLLD